MRLLLVIDSLGSGGAQRLFINIANGLSVEHEVLVFLYNAASDFYRADLNESVPLIRASRDLRKGFRTAVVQELVQHMRRSDLVISFLPTANIYCALARFFVPKIRHISCEMSITNETETCLRRSVTNMANRMSSHVICNSRTQASYVGSQPGMANKVSAIWNGCKELPFRPRQPVDPREHSMIVVGRIAYPKNGLRLLEALQIFYDRNGFIPRVSWAGRDDESMPQSIEMKRQMVAFLESHPEVRSQFRFLGEVSQVEALYTQSDTLILPSIYEGVPVVICEAMLAGCPVIASTVTDNCEILGEREERGFLCDPLSPVDIAAAIERRVFAKPEAVAQMISHAREFAEKEFLMDKMVTEYRQVIESLIR